MDSFPKVERNADTYVIYVAPGVTWAFYRHDAMELTAALAGALAEHSREIMNEAMEGATDED